MAGTKYFTVKATVAVVVFKDETKSEILLTQRNIEPFKDCWCVPGGHIDGFESTSTAAAREVLEETGLKCTPKFEFYCDEIIPELNWHAVALVFSAMADGELVGQPSEVIAIEWVKVSELEGYELAFCHGEVLGRLV